MLPVQNAESVKALTAALGLKGRVKLEVDETLAPVIVTDDLTNSPYTTIVPMVSARRQGAVALNNSAISLEPVAGSILVIDRITLENDAGSDSEFELRFMSAADVATVTTASSGTPLNLNSLFDASGNAARTGALGRNLTNIGLVGTIAGRYGVLDNDQLVIEFPSGFAIYGDDAFGPAALAIWNVVVNESCAANFYARQFLNKG